MSYLGSDVEKLLYSRFKNLILTIVLKLPSPWTQASDLSEDSNGRASACCANVGLLHHLGSMQLVTN